MERKIGEIFEYNGEWYQCIRSILTCSSCEIPRPCTKIRELGYCSPNMRNDKEQVVFRKLEKVGEPMKIHNRIVLKVKADAYKCMRCCFYSKAKCELTIQECKRYDCGEGTKFIEIKQNKEDMEERELDPHMAKVIDEATQKIGEEIGRQIEANINKQRMKPFNLEAAKAGKPVCTRDGRKARIICFDAKDTQPIIGLYEKDINGITREYLCSYHIDGRMYDDQDSGFDLMMLLEKKEGWVNVRRLKSSGYSDFLYISTLYPTKEEAITNANLDVIDTIKITWEE